MKTKRSINEDDIFHAGLAEFAAHGYEDASINTIIRKANISKGSFYYRFNTKYDLYIYILRTCLKQKWDYIRKKSNFAPDPGSPNDIFDLFAIQAKISLDFAHHYPKYHMIGVKFAKEKGTELYNKAIKDLGRTDEAGLSGLIDTAIHNNEFNKRFSKEFIEKMISHLFSSFYEVFLHDENTDIESVYTHLTYYIEFMRNGLAAAII